MANALACEGSRAGVCVVRGLGVVDVDQDTGVGGLVRARERNQVLGLGATATRHGKLSARQVELGTTAALGDVQGDLLVPHQVFASREARGNGHGDGGFA